MSDRPVPTFEEQAAAVHGMPVQSRAGRLAASAERVQGRMILRGYETQAQAQGEAASFDLFQDQRFEVAEVAESLVLETQARVYEEVAISKEALDRIETVTATLRRQEVEVVVEDADLPGTATPQAPATA